MKPAKKAQFILLKDLKVRLEVTFADGGKAFIPMILPKRYRNTK